VRDNTTILSTMIKHVRRNCKGGVGKKQEAIGSDLEKTLYGREGKCRLAVLGDGVLGAGKRRWNPRLRRMAREVELRL
jgi:hypothetical protein